MLYFLINNKPLPIRSILAPGIVQDTFAGEAGESEVSEVEMNGGYFYCYFYHMSSVSIVTSRRRVEIQSTSEMTPYFTMTQCNKLFITFLTRAYQLLPTLPSSISTISTILMTVVMTILFNTRARCSVNFNPLIMG